MFTDEQRARFGTWINDFERLWRLLRDACRQAHRHQHVSAPTRCADTNCWHFRRHWEGAERHRLALAALYQQVPQGLTLPEKLSPELQFGGGGLGSPDHTPELIIVPDEDLLEIDHRNNDDRSVSVSAGVGPPIIGDNPEQFDSWGWQRRDRRPPPAPSPVPSTSS